MATVTAWSPRSKGRSNLESSRDEHIQELFSTELSKYLQSSVFQETPSEALKSVINEAVPSTRESANPDQREVQRQRAVFSALHVLGFQGSRKVSKTTATIKVIAFCDGRGAWVVS